MESELWAAKIVENRTRCHEIRSPNCHRFFVSFPFRYSHISECHLPNAYNIEHVFATHHPCVYFGRILEWDIAAVFFVILFFIFLEKRFLLLHGAFYFYFHWRQKRFVQYRLHLHCSMYFDYCDDCEKLVTFLPMAMEWIHLLIQSRQHFTFTDHKYAPRKNLVCRLFFRHAHLPYVKNETNQTNNRK